MTDDKIAELAVDELAIAADSSEPAIKSGEPNIAPTFYTPSQIGSPSSTQMLKHATCLKNNEVSVIQGKIFPFFLFCFFSFARWYQPVIYLFYRP